MRVKRMLVSLVVAAGCVTFVPTRLFANAHVIIINGNAAGVGFNDPTPVSPVGGNPGTTLGAQRLNAFQLGADIWGATLDSRVDINVLATFEPLSCNATQAVLGSAGPISVWRDFPGVPLPNTWYHAALANKLLGIDLLPAPDANNQEIRARFNVNLGNPGCLTGVSWYLGLDNNHGANVDLVTVLLHEFAHGLGFSSTTNVSTGASLAGLPGAYDHHVLDTSNGLYWSQMTDAQRTASAINPRRVVFDGAQVTTAVPSVLQAGTPFLRIFSPGAIAGIYQVGTAAFGPPLTAAGVIGNVVQGLDAVNAAGPSTTDGCTPLTNVSAVVGKIALIDRGTCGFVVKVKNAQDAGAVAVLIADNVAGAPPSGLGGVDPTITIPSVRLTQSDGAAIKAQLGVGVSAGLNVDLSVRAGADQSGRALLFTPIPVTPGSTISHWDTIAAPNQLMEPAINGDLTHDVTPPSDLTLPLLRDIGWYPDRDLDLVPDTVDQCLGSDLRSTIFIGSEDTGVTNLLFTTGCTIADLINNEASSADNHGGFVSGVVYLTNTLRDQGIITNKDKATLQNAAARSSLP